jgi:hypothetical protein
MPELTDSEQRELRKLVDRGYLFRSTVSDWDQIPYRTAASLADKGLAVKRSYKGGRKFINPTDRAKRVVGHA